MYKVRSNRSTENNTVFLVPNKCIYPTLSQRISMAAKGIPLPDMTQPDGIAKPFLDAEDMRGYEAADLYMLQNSAMKKCQDVQDDLNRLQDSYKSYKKN